MSIEIVPLSDANIAAARALNDRLRGVNETEFFLPSSLPPQVHDSDPIKERNYVAIDGQMVRGGFMLAEFPAHMEGKARLVVHNCREPISEGIIDKSFVMIALRQLKWMESQSPYLFALGMGSEAARFPRLLRGAGWTLQAVPFMFRVTRARAFLTNLGLLQTKLSRRLAARIAAYSGAGALGVAALNARSIPAVWADRRFTLEKVGEWGPWADRLWTERAPNISFSVVRDRDTLSSLYRLGEEPYVNAYVVREGGDIAGWVATRDRRMSGHKYFGSMHVGTILDAVCRPNAMRAAVRLTTRALAGSGSELVISNQSHRDWVQAFKAAGFLRARSNYILALSRHLSKEIGAVPDGLHRMHLTRGDSDGRHNL